MPRSDTSTGMAQGEVMGRYFIFDNECGNPVPEFFKRKSEWQKAMAEYDFLELYCDDGWSPEVTNVFAGVITDNKKFNPEENERYDFYLEYETHRASEFDTREKPENLDEDDCDEDGTSWGDFDFICNYQFEALRKKQ